MNVSNINVALHCSHQLDKIGLPQDHPCTRLHGHTYNVSVEMSYDNNPTALLMDFGQVKKILKEKYDHQHLNSVMFNPPTAENLSKEIYALLVLNLPTSVIVRHVTVAETESNITTYVPEDEISLDVEEEN